MNPRIHPVWQQAAEICTLYEGGMSLKQIARVYDCDYFLIRAVLMDSDIKLRQGRPFGPQEETSWKVQKIKEFRARNMSWRRAGELVGMSGPGALKLVKRWG